MASRLEEVHNWHIAAAQNWKQQHEEQEATVEEHRRMADTSITTSDCIRSYMYAQQAAIKKDEFK